MLGTVRRYHPDRGSRRRVVATRYHPAVSERVTDPQVVCPFVAFDDDRDFRAPGPDHRHRCFAETPAAPRALAHQAAYCLVSAFAGCPTFLDWARREAAPPKVEVLPRSPRDPAAAPRGALGAAAVDGAPAAAGVAPASGEPASRSRSGDWTAPPPWAGATAGAATAAGAGAAGPPTPDPDGEANDRGAAGAPGTGGGLPPEPQVASAPAGSVPPAVDVPPAGVLPPDDTPAFLAGRSTRSAAPPIAAAGPPAAAPAPTPRDAEAWPDDGVELEPVEEGVPVAPRPVQEPRRAPVGYVAVAATKGDSRSPSSRGSRTDPGAPSWEQPRRSEAYPSLRSRGGSRLPRPAIYAVVILLIGLALFASPFLLKGLGGGGGTAPTPSPSAAAVPSAAPSPTSVPTPAQVVYVVKAGDVLSTIATKNHTTVEAIMKANPTIKNPNTIAIGDQIVIPQPLPSEIVNGGASPSP